ncbi:hypothetical protein [Blautia producta]|uniref:hypothetical protein n=1 Tax=Blautia producta TaxID=33035 RepID=UPI0031B60053
MNNRITSGNGKRMCLNRRELSSYLGCGQATADRISREAQARVRVGRRILILTEKVDDYLRSSAE